MRARMGEAFGEGFRFSGISRFPFPSLEQALRTDPQPSQQGLTFSGKIMSQDTPIHTAVQRGSGTKIDRYPAP